MRILKDISKFNQLLLNLPRSAIIFLLGLFFYAMTYGKINLLNAILGVISMVIAYSAVYPFNDINDVEHDKKDSFKKLKNPIASGKLKVDSAASLMFLLLVLGFLFSVPLNSIFRILFFFALFFNFVNSSSYTKSRYRTPFFKSILVFFMQFSKFSMGWFSQTLRLAGFPFVIGFVVSLIYSACYYAYKKQMFSLKDFLDNKKLIAIFIFLFIICIALTLIFFEFKFLLFSFVILFVGHGIFIKIYGVKKSFLKLVFHFLYCLVIITTVISIYFYSTSSLPHKLDNLLNNRTEEIRITVENATNSTLTRIVDEIQKVAIIQDIMGEANKTVIAIKIGGSGK